MTILHKTYERARGTLASYAAFGGAIFSLFTIIFMTPIKEEHLPGDMGLRLNVTHAETPTSDGTSAHGSFSSDSSGATGDGSSGTGSDGGTGAGSDGGAGDGGGCDGGGSY